MRDALPAVVITSRGTRIRAEEGRGRNFVLTPTSLNGSGIADVNMTRTGARSTIKESAMATHPSQRQVAHRELCLFIDESGDFESVHKPWVLGGVLVSAPRERAEELLQTHVLRTVRDIKIHRPADLHMTELAEGRDSAEAAEVALSLMECQYIVGFLGIVNRRFRRIGLREGDYRLMVSDLLVAASKAIGPAARCRSLDIVLATRTIAGVVQTGDVNVSDAMSASSEMFARELVSRGLFELLDSTNTCVSLAGARSSWGLGFADVFCNCLWISEIDRANPRGGVVSSPKLASRVLTSVAYADARERRAENLRVEGQLGPSIAAWLLCEPSERRRSALRAIMESAFAPIASVRGRLAVEAALETLHREYRLSPLERSNLAAELGAIACDVPRGHQSALRCGNFAVLHANHAGDSGASRIALRLSDSVVGTLRGEPEQWPRVAELELLRSESFLNELDEEQGWTAIRRHHDLVNSFGAAWELANDGTERSFAGSALSVRAELAELRFGLWSKHLLPAQVRRRLDAIAHSCVLSGDASRYLCLSAAVSEREDATLAPTHELCEASKNDAWAAYWALRLPLTLGCDFINGTVNTAREWASKEGLPSYLRAALLREVSLASSRSGQAGLAERSADDALAAARSAGRACAATMLLDASVTAARAVATGSAWRWKHAGSCAAVDHRIASAGILTGTVVSLKAALHLRLDSVR
jgi:hypothetical protein